MSANIVMAIVCILSEYGPGLRASRVGAYTGQPPLPSMEWNGMFDLKARLPIIIGFLFIILLFGVGQKG